MEKIFDEIKMYTYMRGYLQGAKLTQSLKALSYARNKHAGTLRKDGSPYIIHPLTMACHAASLGLTNDDLFCGILLHDIVEDCNVSLEELPFSHNVKAIVGLLTFKVLPGRDKEAEKKIYYDNIISNPIATIIKLLDRCHNVSSMSGTFTLEKLKSYIEETRTYVIPMLKLAKEYYPEFSNELYILKYHIVTMIDSIEAAINCKE